MTTPYPHLFSQWQIRNTTVANRVAFAPTCPTWVADPHEGTFTDQAVAYYEERAKGGVGLIIIGGNVIHPDALYSPFLFPGLWKDAQIEGLAKIAEAVHRHDCRLAVQLLHVGLRAHTGFKTDPAYDPEATWYMVGPSQVPLGEFSDAPIPKELEDEEIDEILDAYAAAARRAIAAGLDGVEVHMAHGYLPWQFLSPLYNKRTDRWGGSYEKRLRFPVEAIQRTRSAIGQGPFLGYRMNSVSFWPGDLELADTKRIAVDLEQECDIDYHNVSAGVHHSYIHTPMDWEGGWERPYTRAIKEVTTKPVMLVGRITDPNVAEDALAAGDADVALLARQLFADPEWANKARTGETDNIRPCVAANYCWRTAAGGARVQCVYNPTVGREAIWGSGSLTKVRTPKRILIVGAGPAGLEYARVAAARGHEIVVYEADAEVGGHVRVHALLPGRSEYGRIAEWLVAQAKGNGTKIWTSSPVTADNLNAVLGVEQPDHVVVATGSHFCRDGFQGQTAAPLPGWETGNCVTWDEVVTGKTVPSGRVLVIDDTQDATGPLTAVKCATEGAESVRIVTRWPMLGIDTLPEVYFIWIQSKLYEANVQMTYDHFVKTIDNKQVTLFNTYRPEAEFAVDADLIIMATGRQSNNELYSILKTHDISVETIGDATAPRGTYEAVYEGHRQARKP